MIRVFDLATAKDTLRAGNADSGALSGSLLGVVLGVVRLQMGRAALAERAISHVKRKECVLL